MPSIDRKIEVQEQELGVGTSRFMPRSGYTASKYESTKYSVKGLSYPDDLMDSPDYGNSRVIFYINVSVDSRVIKTGTDVAVSADAVQRDMRGDLIGKKITSVQAGLATAGAGAFGAVVGGKLLGLSPEQLFKNLTTTQTVGLLAGAGAAFGAAGTALIASNVNNQESGPNQEKPPTFSRPQKRLQAAIALYIPNQLSIRYSSVWGEEDTMAFQAAASVGTALSNSGQSIMRAINGDTKRSGGGIGELVQSVATAAAIGGAVPFGKEMGIGAGLAANPKKEQSFKNVDFRTFTFDYLFAPRSEEEAKSVMNIITAFKYHMHPEFKSPDNFLYVYPSEFDITYYKGGTENLNIHRHTSCVLTEMNVNYTPNGVFTTFPNGMATQISVTLTFRELMLLSKESIENYT